MDWILDDNNNIVKKCCIFFFEKFAKNLIDTQGEV